MPRAGEGRSAGARRPSKVLHVMNSAAGGAAMSTIALMRGLRAQGIASSAVCHQVGSREEREAVLDATGGEAIFTVLHSWNRKFRTPWHQRPVKSLKLGLRTGWARRSAARVAAHARSTGADLIHTNTILNPEGGIAARALGLPHVWHLRELLGPGAWFQLPLQGRALGKRLARRCSLLVANSEAAAAAVRDAVPESLLVVVPNGLDLTPFDTPKPRPASNELVVGMVGNLGSHVKKHALFIDAAARVSRALPIQFRIYGAAPPEGRDAYADGLRSRVARHALSDRFHFMGHHPDPAAVMREIDVLVHPSDLESFGRIIVEAMASRLPVVGVRGGGVAAIVEDGVTGLLAECDSASDIAVQIERLAADAQLRRAMGEAGRRRAEADYSIDTHVARMLDVYARAMERPL